MPSLGTSETLGSLPLFSAFRLGRLAGGGIRLAEATLPRDCRPWRGGTDMWKRKNVISTDGSLKPKTNESYGAGTKWTTGMTSAKYTNWMLNNKPGLVCIV